MHTRSNTARSPRRTSPPTRDARRGQRGFTLIEVIVVIVIIGVLAALIGPRLIGRVGQSKQATASSNAAAIASAIRLYHTDAGAFPDAIGSLAQKSSLVGSPYVENADQLKDPWGRLYVLKVPGQKNVDFDVISYGADGKPGGEGEDADVIKP